MPLTFAHAVAERAQHRPMEVNAENELVRLAASCVVGFDVEDARNGAVAEMIAQTAGLVPHHGCAPGGRMISMSGP